ncbi:hypothetical protein MRB53_002418 [Persea americana]|uniref:Uncharacterized protein n=1 Tax=Persea americana TaxID=3435 RepID=A0ACC2MUQ2_PERAE|nr:hypothetical protein MRB53_002418 [Persea americana]
MACARQPQPIATAAERSARASTIAWPASAAKACAPNGHSLGYLTGRAPHTIAGRPGHGTRSTPWTLLLGLD